MSLLTVTDLVRQFDVEPVLNRATFDVRLGDRIGLVGPNGAGKTTLLRILVGIPIPDRFRSRRVPTLFCSNSIPISPRGEH
jgi:ATP-binding cassette subfamily F protein 3